FLIFFSAFAVAAFDWFSPLDGDEFALSATYNGYGVVSIYVDNKSDKTLEFEKKLKLMLWSTNSEVKKISDDARFKNTKFEPHTSGIMTIDISNMYDIKDLESQLDNDDHYYFVLTNNDFKFGYDWHCVISFDNRLNNTFDSNIEYVDKVDLILDENEKIGNDGEIIEELKPYFEDYVINPSLRNEKVEKYFEIVDKALDKERKNGKNIVRSVNPLLLVGDPDSSVTFDERVPQDRQYALIGEHHYILDAYNIPAASRDEDCLVLSTVFPQRKGDINSPDGAPLDILYIFQYDLKEIKADDAYVFIRGRLLNYQQLEKYKIYEDNEYVSYNMTDLFYSNIEDHINVIRKSRSDIYYDDGVKTRVLN
ncbi:MAG: hypothetical protein K2G03_04005, partial [Bacilli bacterium]|nr:hypothetical protein [Bacilli bacterium]